MLVSDGELDVDGGELVNARVENATSLPTTTYGVGRQVFYSGVPCWWNGTKWLALPPDPYRTLYVDLEYPNIYPYFSSVANAQDYARNNFSSAYVTFEIYNTDAETITFNSTDNYFVTLNYNTGMSNIGNGSLTIDVTYTKQFVIDGNGVFYNLYIVGGSTSDASIVKVAKVTTHAYLYADNKLYVDIEESNYITILTNGGTAADPKSGTDFRITGKFCSVMNVLSGGTAFDDANSRFVVDVDYVQSLTYNSMQGGEYNIRCKVIGILDISCGDAVIKRDTRIYVHSTRITQHCSIAGHASVSAPNAQYYLYAYLHDCQIFANSSYDHAVVINPLFRAKIFIDSSNLNCPFSNQYGIKIISNTSMNSQLYVSHSKIISVLASIYNAGTTTFTAVSQSSTCRQAIGSYVTVTGSLTQNAAFF